MVNERMQQLINAVSNGNKRAFSQLVGVTPTVVENIVGTRKGKPGYELLEKIAFAIENVNMDWLLTGRGSMLKQNVQNETNSAQITGNALISSDKDKQKSHINQEESSYLYKIYQEEKSEWKEEKREKDTLLKEKDTENKHLQSELRAMEKELSVLKALHSQSQDKEPESRSSMDKDLELFSLEPSEASIKGYSPTSPPAISKKLSAGKI